MKKSIAIVLLVATSVVAIAVGAGIWYTRPSAPLAILEEAKARQAQPLLEVTPPQRAEVIPLPPDYQPLIDELLPLLKAELTPASETTLSREQQAYVDQAVETLRRELLQSIDTQANRAYVDRQVDSLKRELTTGLARVEEKQLDRQALIDSVTADDLRPIFSVYRDELLRQVRAEQPRTTVVMSGDIDEEVLFNNLAWEIEDNLDFYATYARDAILSTIDSSDVIALYESYRPLLVADLATSLPPSTTVIATAEPIDPQQVFNEFAKEIETNKTFYATYVRDAVLDTISEEDLLGFYTYYRPVLLADLVGESPKGEAELDLDTLLENFYTEIEANKYAYATYVRDALLETMIGDPEFDQAYEASQKSLNTAEVLNALGEEIEANKSLYATYVRDAILDTISEDDLVDLYLTYRDALIEDLGTVDHDQLMLLLVQEIERNQTAYATWARDAIAETISDDVIIDLYLNYRDLLVNDLISEMPEAQQQADREQFFTALFAEIDSNKSFYAAWARDAIIDTISDEDLISYYLYYRPELLEDIYQGLKDRFAQPTPVVVPPAPSATIQRTVVQEVEETFTPPALVIQEEVPPALVVEEEVAPPAPPQLVVEELLPETPVLSPRVPPAPGAIRKPSTVVDDMLPGEYEELRQQRRNEALDEVLRKLD